MHTARKVCECFPSAASEHVHVIINVYTYSVFGLRVWRWCWRRWRRPVPGEVPKNHDIIVAACDAVEERARIAHIAHSDAYQMRRRRPGTMSDVHG